MMGTLIFFRWAWLVLLMTSSGSSQAVHFDRDLLMTYARLCQQLRAEISDHLRQMQETYEANQAIFEGMDATIQSFTQSFAQDEYAELSDRFQTANVSLANVLGAISSDPFTNIFEPVFNVVTLDHGFSYSPLKGTATVKVTGVYMLEFKNQGQDGSNVELQVDVIQSNGGMRYHLEFFTDMEVSPHLMLLNMESGDRLHIRSFKDSENYVPRFLKAGVANVFTLRYLGKMVVTN